MQPRDSRTVYNDLRTQNADPQTAPNTRRLLNHVLHLPRTIETLIIFFTEAINPLEAGFNTLWGLLHLNILVRYVRSQRQRILMMPSFRVSQRINLKEPSAGPKS